MTTPTNPHPLAVEAAEQVVRYYADDFTSEEMKESAQIIHTTALEPVIRVGEELWEEFRDFAGQNKCGCGHPACSRCRDDRYAEKALAQWRTLTTPPQSTPDRPESTESGSARVTLPQQSISEIHALIGFCQGIVEMREYPLTDAVRDALAQYVKRAEDALKKGDL